MIPYEPNKHAVEKQRAVNYWVEELQAKGHSLSDWESTRPGYVFSAGCRCQKCGLTFLGNLLHGVLVPLPASRMQSETCEYQDWINEAQVIVNLGVTLRKWRKWLKQEAIVLDVRQEYFTYNDNGGDSVTCYHADDVLFLKPWVHRRIDRNGKVYLSLRNPDAEKKEEEPLCPEQPENNSAPASSGKPQKSRSGTKKRASA